MEFNQKDNTHTHIQIYSMNETITLIEPKKIPAEWEMCHFICELYFWSVFGIY